DALTMPEAPYPKGSPFDAVAKLTARVSEPPANSTSYATLGSAALDASQPSLPQPRSRKGVVAVVSLIAVAALVATGVSFTMFRPKPQTAQAAAVNATSQAPSTPPSAMPSSINPAATGSPSASSQAG